MWQDPSRQDLCSFLSIFQTLPSFPNPAVMDIQEIETRALQLPPEQRAALVRHLLASLEEADEFERAWAGESGGRGVCRGASGALIGEPLQMEARFHPDTRAELLDAATYYEARADQLGGQFIDEVHRVVDLLVASPGLGAPVPGQPGLSRWRLRRFPYYVVYREQGEQVCILAVAHERRRPEYWSDRK